MESIINIFLVDDHQLVLDGLEKILAEVPEFSLAGTAANGAEAVARIPLVKPDLVLMDMDMPKLNGLEASRQLLAQLPELPIALLTMHADRFLATRAMQTGLKGYFLKTADQAELISGIKMIAQGHSYFSPEAMLAEPQKGKVIQQGAKEALQLQELSGREQEILRWIAGGHTSKEIAEALHLSTRTVETHRKNIHQKLGIKHLAGLIRFAIKAGMVD